jgi:putative transposase
MSDKGKPQQNGIAERFMRTLKEEHVDYADFDDASRQVAHWLTSVYNTQRIHSALKYATPAETDASYGLGRPLALNENLSSIPTALHLL